MTENGQGGNIILDFDGSNFPGRCGKVCNIHKNLQFSELLLKVY
jgi:hypothetical protein